MSAATSRATIVVRLAKVVELVLGDLGVTVNQYRALTLVAAGAPPMREFALRLAMQQPNVSTLIDGLVDRELVTRRRDPADGRRVVLSLTKRGQTLLHRADARTGEALVAVASFDTQHDEELLVGIDAWQDALDAVAVDVHEGLLGRANKSA